MNSPSFSQAEFYTFSHVIHGLVDTSQERLSDFLNRKSESTIQVYDVQISRILSMGKSELLKSDEVRLEKQSILFANPIERDLNVKSFYRRMVRQIFPIFVLLPYYELVGSVHLTEKLEIRRVLLSRPEMFIPLTDVTATFSLNPSVQFRRNTIVFNKNLMIMIGSQMPVEKPSGTTEDVNQSR